MVEPGKFLHRTAWSYAQALVGKGISAVGFLVVGLVLGPQDLGLFAFAAVLLAIAELLCDQVPALVIVQLDRLDDERLNALLWLSLLTAMIVALLAWAGAGAMEEFFQAPGLARMLALAAPTPILVALAGIPAGILRRQMEFRALTRRTIVAGGCSTLVGVALAFAGLGAQALVWQALWYHGLSAAFLLTFGAWRPRRPGWSAGTLPLVMRFAVANLGNRALDFLELRILELLLGRFAGVEALGVYSFASRLAQTAFQTVTSPLLEAKMARVAGQGGARVAVLVREGLFLMATIPSLAMFVLAAGAGVLLALLYGQRWAGAAPVLSILALGYGTRGFLYLYGVGLLGLGKVGIVLAVSALRVGVCLAATVFAVLAGYGGPGAALAFLGGSVASIPVSAFLFWGACGQAPRIRDSSMLRTLTAALFGAGVAFAVQGAATLGGGEPRWGTFLVPAAAALGFVVANGLLHARALGLYARQVFWRGNM